MNKEEFIAELKKININLSDKQMHDLDTYYKLLVTENQKYNLTSITEQKSVYLKHFYDSLTVVKGIDIDNQYICDIGSGAGFPGLVLKIVFPNIKIDLVDATNKKCNFLKLVKDTLKLENINILNVRAEVYSHQVREKYDIVTSRAVAPLKHLLEYSVPLIKVGGYFVAMKSNLTEEMVNINNYYQKLNLAGEKIIQFKLPFEGSLRSIYTIKKDASTPSIYPREYNQIKKNDL